MVRLTSTDSSTHLRWFRAAARGMALGVLVSLVGGAVGVFAPRVGCELPTPSQLILGVWFTLAGGCLQVVPLAVALSARRRWRTTLTLGGGLLLIGLAAVIGSVWSASLRPVLAPEASVLAVPGMAAIGLGLWLRVRAMSPPLLTAFEANAFSVGAVVLMVASWYASIGVAMGHFCL
jgi:hypothetical protein